MLVSVEVRHHKYSLTLGLSKEISSVDVDGHVKEYGDCDKDSRVLVIAPVLDNGIDDGAFEYDVGCLCKLRDSAKASAQSWDNVRNGSSPQRLPGLGRPCARPI
jgi:hypothetical protein